MIRYAMLLHLNGFILDRRYAIFVMVTTPQQNYTCIIYTDNIMVDDQCLNCYVI